MLHVALGHDALHLGLQVVLAVGKTRSDGAEVVFDLQEGVHDVGVKMAAAPFNDQVAGLIVREGRFLDPAGDQCVVHVRHGHEPG